MIELLNGKQIYTERLNFLGEFFSEKWRLYKYPIFKLYILCYKTNTN